MLKSLKKKMKDQAGLTLIELLVVIVILGIIAAVAIPMVMGNREDAARNTNAQSLSILQDAANRFNVINGEEANDMTDLTGATNGGPFIDVKPTIQTFGSTCTGEGLDFFFSNGDVILGTAADTPVTACYEE